MDAEAAGNVVEGKLLIYGVEAKILFDPRSTHSFLSPMFAKLIAIPISELAFVSVVITSVGKQITCRNYYPMCPVKIGVVDLAANLTVLDMHDFDIILGMDWLTGHRATMDCFNKVITFKLDATPMGIKFQGDMKKP